MNDVPIPRSPGELWTQIVLPHVEEKLKSVPARAPVGVLTPDFHTSFIEKKREHFDREIAGKTDFETWAAGIDNWKVWSRSLIPFEEINPQYLQERLNKICYKKSLESERFSGLLPDTVTKVLYKRPNDVAPEDFFDIVLGETTIRFMGQYFSSFREPMGSWIYKLASSAADDFVKNWVPGFRGKGDKPANAAAESKPQEDVEKKTKGVKVESIDVPRRGKDDKEQQPLSQMLPGKPMPAPENMILLKELRAIHAAKGRRGKLSDVVLELFSNDYTGGEIAEQIGLEPNRVRSGAAQGTHLGGCRHILVDGFGLFAPENPA